MCWRSSAETFPEASRRGFEVSSGMMSLVAAQILYKVAGSRQVFLTRETPVPQAAWGGSEGLGLVDGGFRV